MQSNTDQCVYCRKATGPLLTFSAHDLKPKAHKECRERKRCGLCGHPGMTQVCSEADCYRVFHPWCPKIYSGGTETQVCDVHLYGKKRERYSTIKQTLARVPMNPPLTQSLRILDNGRKCHAAICCTGYVFWYHIGSQYFPTGADLSTLPDFRKGKLSCADTSDVLETWNLDGSAPVDSLLESVVTQLSLNRKAMERLKSELLGNISKSKQSEESYRIKLYGKNPRKIKDLSTEERFVLCDLRLLKHKAIYEEYFKYMEMKQRTGNGEFSGSSTSSSLSVHVSDIPKCEDEFACAVCSDGDYEDDNLIVICSVSATQTCEVAVHMKCYGIPVVPSGDWICSMCMSFGKETSRKMRCVLCSVEGGALKETVHLNTGQLFPHYPAFDESQPTSFSNPPHLWCHVFCAMHLPEATISDMLTMTGVDLSRLDMERCRLKCDLCNSREGACVQCQHRKCNFAFHPECGKDLIVAGKKYGLEDGEIYCLKHRPVKLGKMIENRDKKKVEDISNFCRLWERWESKTPANTPLKRVRKRSELEWTFEEMEQFEDELNHFLRLVNERQSKPFHLFINLRSVGRSGFVQVTGPELFNFLQPEVILSERICISNRTPEECYRFFINRLMVRMKFELDLCKCPVKVYTSKKSTGHKAVKRRPVNQDNPVKRPRKQVLSLEAKKSEELFCVCKQPYIELLPQNGMAEEEYQALIYKNSMVFCVGCGDWFHYGCIGFTPDGNNENDWKCAECRSKENLKMQ